jgi:multidrug efflux pump subunit AcrA (membrane-fusion protein)
MKRVNTLSISVAGALVFASLGFSQAHEFVPVVSKPISRTVDLPGEFLPFLSVSLHAKVPGYVERILVDREAESMAGSFWRS